MWKIKDPNIKRKVNLFITDEDIDKLCRNQMADSSTYIFFSFEDDGVSFRIDKSYFEELTYNAYVWNPYPEIKPAENGYYLITVKDRRNLSDVYLASYDKDLDCWTGYATEEVIAFRNLPEPYQPEENK